MDLHSRLDQNNQYYNQFAAKVEGRTENRDYTHHMAAFTKHLPDVATILDIGCGLGQHMEWFQKAGYETVGIEPSEKVRHIAQSKGLKVFEGSFENVSQLELPPIDGIWTAASLLHIPWEEIPTVFSHIAKRLRGGCPWFITVRTGNDATWDSYDDTNANSRRFIQLFEPEALRKQLHKAGFKIVEEQLEESTWGRPCTWLSLVAVRTGT